MKEEFEIQGYEINIGKIFIKYIPFMKVYLKYLLNYETYVEVYEKNSKKINLILTKTEFKDKNLVEYLVLPKGRLPRYKMIISSLLDCTPEEHNDFETLKYSITLLNELLMNIQNQFKL
jgi:hypothetical protein